MGERFKWNRDCGATACCIDVSTLQRKGKGRTKAEETSLEEEMFGAGAREELYLWYEPSSQISCGWVGGWIGLKSDPILLWPRPQSVSVAAAWKSQV